MKTRTKKQLWKVRYDLPEGGHTEVTVTGTGKTSADQRLAAERKAIAKARKRFGAVDLRFSASWPFNPPTRYYQRAENGGMERKVAGAVCCHAWLAVVPWVSRDQPGILLWLAVVWAVFCLLTGRWFMGKAREADQEAVDQDLKSRVLHLVFLEWWRETRSAPTWKFRAGDMADLAGFTIFEASRFAVWAEQQVVHADGVAWRLSRVRLESGNWFTFVRVEKEKKATVLRCHVWLAVVPPAVEFYGWVAVGICAVWVLFFWSLAGWCQWNRKDKRERAEDLVNRADNGWKMVLLRWMLINYLESGVPVLPDGIRNAGNLTVEEALAFSKWASGRTVETDGRRFTCVRDKGVESYWLRFREEMPETGMIWTANAPGSGKSSLVKMATKGDASA